MKQVIINRLSDCSVQTLGVLSFAQDNGHVFMCKTLELPSKINHPHTSCITEGSYRCSITQSPGFSAHPGHAVFTYKVEHVPHRAVISIHSANFSAQLLGCIALGGALEDINGDGEQDITASRNTVHTFENELRQEPFTQIIQSVPEI